MTRQRAKIKCELPDAAKPWKVCSFHGVNLKRHHQQVHKKKQNLAAGDMRVAGSGFAPGEAHAHWCPGSQVSGQFAVSRQCVDYNN